MAKKKNELTVQGETQIDEQALFKRVSEIIETRKSRAGAYANEVCVGLSSAHSRASLALARMPTVRLR